MASITFDGPSPLDTKERVVTVVNISDEALLAVVQGFCELEGYNPEGTEGPGEFTIRKTIEFWSQKAEYNIRRKANNETNIIVDAQLAPLKSSIVVSKGVPKIDKVEEPNLKKVE